MDLDAKCALILLGCVVVTWLGVGEVEAQEGCAMGHSGRERADAWPFQIYKLRN